MRTSGSLKSLIHGITTDKAKLADPRYLKEQINIQTQKDSGLHKRPSLRQNLVDLFPTYRYDGTVRSILKQFRFRDTDYALMIQYDVGQEWDTSSANRALEVRELDTGTVVPSTWEERNFAGCTDEAHIEFIEQGDTVWILNKVQVPAMATDLRVTEKTSHILVKSAPADSSSMTISWEDTTGTPFSTIVTVGTPIAGRGTNVVAGLISAAINATGGMTGVTASFAGSSVAIVRTDGEYAKVTVQDEDAGGVLVPINGYLTDIVDLPRWLAGSQTLKIKPEKNSERGVFYMRSESDTSATAPTVPASDAEFISAKHNYNASYPSRYNTGVSTETGTSGCGGTWFYDYGTWTSKLTISGLDAIQFIFQHDLNGTGLHWLVISPCGGASPPGFTSGAISRITVRRKSDLSLVYDSPVTVADESSWGSGVYYRISTPEITLTTGESYYIYINKTAGLTNNLTQVNWVESAGVDEKYKLDETTMPYLLTNDENGDVVNNTATWSERGAGDATTNKEPAFIGKTIQDMAVFQNRLCVLSDNQLITTETDDNLSWFRSTVTQLLPTHPVRIRSTAKGLGTLTHLVHHNRDLMIFSNEAQLKISGDIALTPEAGGMPVAATYRTDTSISPVSLGDSVFFPYTYGKYWGVYRYYPDEQSSTDKDVAIPITDHTKKYIEGTPLAMLGEESTGELYLVTEEGNIYVCDYDTEVTRQEDRRYAWSLWKQFGDKTSFTIKSAVLRDRQIHLMLEDTANAEVIQYCTLNTVNDPTATDKRFHLDFAYEDTIDGSYQITLETNHPFTVADIKVIVNDPTHAEYGNAIDYTEAAGVLTFDAAYANVDVFVGQGFRSSIKPQTQYITDQGGFINSATKFRIGRWFLHMAASATVWAKIISNHYTFDDQFWSGLSTNDLYSEMNEIGDKDGVFVIAYKQRNDLADLEIYSDTHLPFNFLQLEWMGNYTSRGRRL